MIKLAVYSAVALVSFFIGMVVSEYGRIEQHEEAILWCLKREPGMRGLELCGIVGAHEGIIYRLLGRLEERGLIRSERRGEFGVFHYYLTEKGELL